MTAPHSVPESLGASIRAARREARLTQTELGELAGLSDRTVREIENGSPSPAVGSVLRLLEILGLHVSVTR
ncbi:helix-turn-helix domain-containing protein [Brachybacterium sp. JHP9]|uniref:Helix-turn-helix domain-containing protein n=1 Tax=Brachybacterium equifaecis TaxID=2910770 RepID=A0ABT0R2P8_9MICO|nr:helix-turn-helix domain-containing protein [Brachybacterium equifaecis]MCL6424202.1 helix-turn-helix domain-containing protein [Brachybacterium equifaecis]